MGSASGIGGLEFLVGAWRGAGVVRGAAVTSQSVCEPFGADMLTLDTETFRGAQRIHRERILWRREPDGSVTCTTSPWRSKAQVWRVEAVEADRTWRHLHPGLRWEISRTLEGNSGAPAGDAYDETFDVVGADGVAVRVVTLRHERVAVQPADSAATGVGATWTEDIVLEEPSGGAA